MIESRSPRNLAACFASAGVPLVAALLGASALTAGEAAQKEIVLTDHPPYVTPFDVEIGVGESVTWRNAGPEETHAVTDEALALFSMDLPVGEAWSFTFDKAGVYPFVCFRHHFMRGTVTVRNPDGSTLSEPDFPYQKAFREYPIPTRNAVPRMILVSPIDGAVWFTEGGGGFYGFEDLPPQNKLGRLDPSGSIIEYATPTPNGDGTQVGVDSLVMDAEGAIWFTERLTNRIGKLSPDGVITEVQIPTEGGYALGIDLDRDGNVWFAERYGNRLGRLTPDGVLTEFELPEPDSEPRTVFVDSENRVWYTARTANEIGWFDPETEEFVRLEIPTELARPTGIAETGDGAIYFVEMVGNKIGKVVGNQITEYPIPTKFSAPFKIVADAEDNLWFTQVFGNSIGKLDPRSGKITEFKIPTPDSRPGGIDVDGQGRVWFVEQTGNKVGMFDPAEAERAGFEISDIELPHDGGGPGNDLIEDEQGWIWFNQIWGNRIGAVHRDSRAYRDFELPTSVSMPVGLARDPDGILWATEFRGNRLARIDPDQGTVEEYEIPIDAALPSGVAVTPDGAVWLTLLGANSVARFEPRQGVFRHWEMPVAEASPLMIVAAPDGRLWITLSEERGNQLVTFDPASESFEAFPLPTPNASPTGLLLDGRWIWVAEGGAGKLARFDRAEQSFEEYTIPAPGSEPVKLAKDRRGRIWLTDGGGLGGVGGNRLVVFDPLEESFELIPMEREGAKPRGILAASDGSIWFTQQNANLVSRLELESPAPAHAAGAPQGSPRLQPWERATSKTDGRAHDEDDR